MWFLCWNIRIRYGYVARYVARRVIGSNLMAILEMVDE